jgi:diguanylate cyclase (GGDEF)-like protein
VEEAASGPGAMKKRSDTDLLAIVSVMCIAAFVAILCLVAAVNPGTRQLLMVVIAGLCGGGLILFRQLRKAANSLIASEARAHYVATHDQLTQLPNKTLLIERLRALGQGSHAADPAGILCIGLDRFEEVSDVLGLRASDDVVLEVVTRLNSLCGPRDIIARLGDDLFVLVALSAQPGGVEAVAGDVIEFLAAPYRASDGKAVVTCSIGIATLAMHHANPVEALRQAQLALTSARKLGGSRYTVFELSLDRELKSRKAMQVELGAALAQGALNMVYQPQANAKGAFVGVEALMRWTSPERGTVSPAVFVPLAESCGLSDSLGRFALRQAFLDSKNWPALKVAINVSGAQVRSGALVATLQDLVAETGVDPKNFELEITEGVLLADEAETYETLNAVRKLGFSLSLDDFGTGYSSLSYLRRFPVDKIKIDQSFIAHLGKRPESSAIVKAIIDMADALAMNIIAEGVETIDQVQFLVQSGCGLFQGYYFSRPVDAQELTGMLARRLKIAA